MGLSVVRGADYGLASDYLARAHVEILVALLIEIRAAAPNTAAIAAVDGVDMIFVGPNDLSSGLGQVGDTGHPLVEAAIREVCAAARAAGKPLGTVPFGGRNWAQTFAAGFNLVATGSDIYWFREATSQLAPEWREQREGG